jgi:hypothetical protein
MSDVLHWWPVLAGLAVVIAMFTRIESQSKQTRDDLKEHRAESKLANKEQGEKIDTIAENVHTLQTDVAVMKALRKASGGGSTGRHLALAKITDDDGDS